MAVPATFKDIQDTVMKKMKLVNATDRTWIKDQINIAYADLAMESEYFETAAQITLTAGASAYTLPSAVARIDSVTIKPVGQSSYGVELQEVGLSQLQDLRYTGATTGAGSSSTHYCLVGAQQLELWPAPVAADTLRMYYVYLPMFLNADGDVPAFPEPYGSKALEYYTLAEVADFLDDGKENNYRQLALYWIRKLRQHKNRIANKGGVWQLPIANAWPRFPVNNDVDIRG